MDDRVHQREPCPDSTIEEKSNKVMEVLLSAVSPMQLMAGRSSAAVASLMFVMYGLRIGLFTLAMTALLQLLLLSFAYFVIAYFTIMTLGGGRERGVRAPGRSP